jgi:hypothetical protein
LCFSASTPYRFPFTPCPFPICLDCSGYPEHDHGDDGHEEVYVVLRGSVVLRTDSGEHTLSQGDFVRVAPETKRKFVTRSQDATLLALGGTPGQPYAPSMGRRTAADVIARPSGATSTSGSVTRVR